MKTLGRLVVGAALLALLNACLPVATFETAEPADGQQVVVGLTGVVAVSSDAPVGGLPYLAYRWGNGETEFSVSTQIGLRGGVKQKVADRFSVAAGLTVPWAVFSSSGGPSLPFTVDAEALFQATDELTVIGRGMYAAVSDFGGAWLGGASVVYRQDRWLFEGGFLMSSEGNPILSVSAGYRF
ncbi:hypothetical protein [Oceanithermus profundus]|uniref:Outer membrane protein beta-barrel domain-containing protein n=1 Tax=Oceanithermus profundus (strain DSM 14977 / NBRC 100410 / VKM B-2274 / 506) TaxID=670487 RepID=E4U8V3_OCEP5|nr:hypothetical protein [Oceanithermus profundus]ADR36783.1 hypothetical protein Ocepr_1326 [Oceanithermus profundus DSM 14977]